MANARIRGHRIKDGGYPQATHIVLSAQTILDNAVQGDPVGTASTNLDVSVNWAQNNTNFQLSSTSGVTTELQRSGTGSLTSGVSESVTITATRPGAGSTTFTSSPFTINVASASGAPVGTFVTSFQVANWSTSSSVGFWRGGMPFADGDVPSGAVPIVQTASGVTVSAQFDQRSTWSSGCLRFAVCSLRDSSWTNSESRFYNVYQATGSYNNTGTKTVTDITATSDFTITVSSFTQYNGTTTVARGSGAALASFNTDCLTTTRITKVASGGVREAWMIWGAFYDGADGSGAADAHLKPIWYVDLWKAANGAVADVEYAAVVSQDWWSVASKYRLNYNATLKDGASTINTYSSIQHPYRSQWITVRTNSDDGASKRFWKNSMPTLFYKPDKDYWVSTGIVPELDTSFSPTSNSSLGYTAVYTPCGNMNHNAYVDAAGGSMGRGIINNCDAVSFMRQTSADYRYGRNNALAGLGFPSHYRSNNTRTRPTESADVANTIISLILDPQAAANYTFTAQGMPAPVNAYIGAAGVADGYVAPLGGTGVWSGFGQDASHLDNYSYFMYLLEGERYLLEATLDIAAGCQQRTAGNEFAGRPRLLYYDITAYRTAFSIPTTAYGGVGQMRQFGAARATAWALNLMASAYAITPDDDVQCGFVRAMLTQNLLYCATSMNYMPTTQKDAGWWTPNQPTTHPVWSQYMEALICLAASTCLKITGDPNAETLLNMVANTSIGAFESLTYLSKQYRGMMTPKAIPWAAGTNDFFARGQWLYGPLPCVIASVGDTVTLSGPSWFNYTVTNGDVFYPSSVTEGFVTVTIPSELTEGSPYYAVNTTGTSFQLSASPGGSAINFASNSTSYFNCRLADMNHAIAADPPCMPSADDYPPINLAALTAAHNAGVTDADLTAVTAAQTFLQNVDQSNWPVWKYMVL